MARLKDRQRQIPGGFRFSLPEVAYESSPFSSFDQIVNSVTKITNANPDKAVKYDWPMERAAVADWVDAYNAKICEANNWREFYIAGGGEHHSCRIEYDGWPLWAKAMEKLRTPEDKGVGDTVHRIIGEDNSDKLKEWYLKTFHRICGCDGRKAEWNVKYSY